MGGCTTGTLEEQAPHSDVRHCDVRHGRGPTQSLTHQQTSTIAGAAPGLQQVRPQAALPAAVMTGRYRVDGAGVRCSAALRTKCPGPQNRLQAVNSSKAHAAHFPGGLTRRSAASQLQILLAVTAEH